MTLSLPLENLYLGRKGVQVFKASLRYAELAFRSSRINPSGPLGTIIKGWIVFDAQERLPPQLLDVTCTQIAGSAAVGVQRGDSHELLMAAHLF